MKKKRSELLKTISGYVVFLFTVAVIVCASVAVYIAAEKSLRAKRA